MRTIRSRFLKQLFPLLGAGLVAVTAARKAPAQPASPTKPNILFIFTDDHAWQALSAYGHKVQGRALNQTPNLDRIAREGMRFDRCLTPNPLCGPSRATILTGKHSHLNGFFNNTNNTFDGNQVTFPKLLQANGYQTGIIGKWHLVSDPTGFDHWEILPGQGLYYNPPMIRNGERVRQQGYVSEIITERSLDWLKKRDANKPFMLMLQHKAPHREWSPSLKVLGRYGETKFPEPPTLFDDYAGRGKAAATQDMTLEKTFTPLDAKLTTPPSLNAEQRKVWDAYYGPRNEAFRKANPQGKDLVRWRYQRYMHDYLSTVASVDDGVGEVLDYLKESGLDKNTVVVYASDQGFFLGEHGWFDKRWIYEEATRTPFLVRWPGVTKPGSVSKELVSNLDFAQTFLEMAGVPAPAEMQGRSVVPLLKGKAPADWRKSLYFHYYEYPGPHSVRRHYGVITDRYKLAHFYEPDMEYWELFDRREDPREMKSLYDDPKYRKVREELSTELVRLRQQYRVTANDPEGSLIPARRPAPAP